MDQRLQHIVDNIENMKIGADDSFRFGCKQCGRCCMNREDILCNPKDVFRISKKLGLTPGDFIKRNCDTYLGSSSHMPIVRIIPHDAAGHCAMLKNRKCVVHECKPTVCAMYPIGRMIRFDLNKPDYNNISVSDIQFLFTHPDCGDKSESHTVREWLAQFGIPIEDEFYIKWNQTISILSPLMQIVIDKFSTDHADQIISLVFIKLYLDYDLNKEFYSQFVVNADQVIEMLRDLTARGGEESA